MNLEPVTSLQALLNAENENVPLFIVTGRLAGQSWRLTYHAGHGVENTVVARALLTTEGAVIASVRRAAPADVSAAYLSWRDDPHFPLLQHAFPGGAAWQAQRTLLGTFPLVRAVRDGPDVRAALDAFTFRDGSEWRFRGVRVLPGSGVLLAYAPDDAALRSLLRPLLLQVPDALPAPPSEAPPSSPHEPGGAPRRRRVPPRR